MVEETKNNAAYEYNGAYGQLPENFALWNRLISRDINKNNQSAAFSLYSKEDIQRYLSDPAAYEKQLRNAVKYIYEASSHFRRLIEYFAGLTIFAYIVTPYKLDQKKANAKTVYSNYRKVLNTLCSMNIKTQFPKILTVCLREDVFYGTMWVTSDDISIQQLPSDYCAITTIEGGVPNVTFDFSYFDSRKDLLEYYPREFKAKYDTYLKDRMSKWIELDSPTSFAVKCNNDTMGYAVPPFIGLLRELYDIEDYKKLKLTKTGLENYAMLAMTLPMDKDGNWGIDYDKAKEFWSNLDSVLPDEVGSVLTPMPITKIGFDKSNTGDTDTVADAEQHLFTAAGVPSLLFNNEKASSNALLLSIKADQAITYGIVRSIEDVVNRFIQSQNYGKNFKVNFLDISPYNSKEAGEAYLKAASYGLPTISAYAASQGLGQAELDAMSYLEGSVLNLTSLFKPIQNSSQMGKLDTEKKGATDEGGAPHKDPSELTDSGEQSSEQHEDWG